MQTCRHTKISHDATYTYHVTCGTVPPFDFLVQYVHGQLMTSLLGCLMSSDRVHHLFQCWPCLLTYIKPWQAASTNYWHNKTYFPTSNVLLYAVWIPSTENHILAVCTCICELPPTLQVYFHCNSLLILASILQLPLSYSQSKVKLKVNIYTNQRMSQGLEGLWIEAADAILILQSMCVYEYKFRPLLKCNQPYKHCKNQ